jgi:hypothetical protein
MPRNENLPVEVVHRTSDSRETPRLEWLEWLAWLLDRAIRIPGTRIEVGLDGILGLLPVAGDTAAAVLQAVIVLVAAVHFRVPPVVVTRMVVNVLIDTALGAIPVLGDFFDIYFKASVRNVELIRQVQEEQRNRAGKKRISQWRHWVFLLGLVLALVALIGLLILGTAALFKMVLK